MNSMGQREEGRLFALWESLLSRCISPSHALYPTHGAKGISVCRAWRRFEDFRRWALSSGYAPGLKLVRADPALNYHPNTCRWVARVGDAPGHAERVRLRGIWRGMMYRCDNPNSASFPRYGGRGIRVCRAWYDFDRFSSWALANGYASGLTIDRINNNRDYAPANCQWIPLAENAGKDQMRSKYK